MGNKIVVSFCLWGITDMKREGVCIRPHVRVNICVLVGAYAGVYACYNPAH